MIKGAIKALKTLSFFARLDLVVERMVHLLLPAMTLCTEGLEGTALLVLADKVASLPVLAKLPRVVVEEVRFAAEILPVVSVYALGLVVLRVEGAPLRLEVEHVEDHASLHAVDQTGFNVALRMSK